MVNYYLSILIFLVSYAFIVSEKFDKSLIVFIGAYFLLANHVLTQEEAIKYIDFNTIGLLCGMMIMVAIIKKTGLFEYIAVKSIKQSKGDLSKLLLLFTLITAILSALLDNITTVLIIAPITIAFTETSRINALPFLLLEIFASNIGGTATLIGDPPNIIIGSAANIGFMDYLYNNTIPIALILIVCIFVIKRIFHKDFRPDVQGSDIHKLFDENKIISDMSKVKRTIIIFSFTMFLFLTHDIHHIDAATIALGCSFILLLVTKFDPIKIFSEIETSSLLFLSGIFILVGSLEHENVLNDIATFLMSYTENSITRSSLITIWFSGIGSAFLDNIPLTTLMVPIIKTINSKLHVHTNVLWWSLSLGACLGGNGTIVGAAANIIVIHMAKKNNIMISFWDYFKISFPLMCLSLLIATGYIYLRFLAF